MPHNIIFCFTGQQRWDTSGCFGHPLDITPNLDRLAAGVLEFTSHGCDGKKLFYDRLPH